MFYYHVSKYEHAGDTKTTHSVFVESHFLWNGHSFFTDNYYTSTELMNKFEDNKTLTCRTVDAYSSTLLTLELLNKMFYVKTKMKYCKSLKCKKGWMVAITWKVTCIINSLCNLSGSLDVY